MRLDLSRIVLGLIYLATTGVVALMSDIGLVVLSTRFHSMDCVRESCGVTCQLAAPMSNNKLSLMVFMLAGMFVYLVYRHRASASNFAPFAMFLSAMLVACTACPQHLGAVFQHGQHLHLYPHLHLRGDGDDPRL
jgi:hypothetical protein